jgi:hypothetical protein
MAEIKSTNAQKTANIAEAAKAIAEIGTAIWSTAAQIKDMKERANVEKNIALLNQKQADELNRELLRTQDVNRRIEILTNAVANVRSAQTSTILSGAINLKDKAQGRKDILTTVLVLGGAIAILVAIVIIKKK